jgi:mono/diheme cytochrome c family protein
MKMRLVIALVIAILLALLFAAPALSAQEVKLPGCTVPEEAAKKANPSKADADSVDEGRRLFVSQCALCHGKAADGKGELAEPMKLTMRDYRDAAALKGISDGAMFHVLNKGCGQMPGEEGRLKEPQMWNLINYIRSLAKKSDVAAKKDAPPPQ